MTQAHMTIRTKPDLSISSAGSNSPYVLKISCPAFKSEAATICSSCSKSSVQHNTELHAPLDRRCLGTLLPCCFETRFTCIKWKITMERTMMTVTRSTIRINKNDNNISNNHNKDSNNGSDDDINQNNNNKNKDTNSSNINLEAPHSL